MTPKTIKVGMYVAGFLGGGFILAVLGFAMQFWIAMNVQAEVAKIVHPIDMVEAQQLLLDITAIKTSLGHIEGNVDTALASQERFEEQFTAYLIGEAQ